VIDPALLRDNPDVVRRSQTARGDDVALVDAAISADTARRSALTEFETLRAEQNVFSKKVGQAQGDEKKALLAEVAELAQRVKDANTAANTAEEAYSLAVSRLGNLVIDGVPAGSEENFVTLRTHGSPAQFNFEPKDHLELGEGLDAIDTVRGAKVSGARFYFLKGVGARLELALMNMALDQALEAGFTPLITPTLVRPEIMNGTGFLGAHSDEIYYLPADDLYLTGTSEVALAGYHADEIVDVSGGPLRYAGWSTCYRREAGSGGKDTRGIIRVHQLVAWQEAMLQKLGLAYRVIDVAAGDLGSSAARKFDIEAWIPTQDAYRELTSTSNCTTFQARRLQTRFRTESGKTEPVATLNGTLATTRWLVAILETHQQADGSVIVPEALRPFIGGLDVLKPVIA
jgi:seryl-tRNA synthetase